MSGQDLAAAARVEQFVAVISRILAAKSRAGQRSLDRGDISEGQYGARADSADESIANMLTSVEIDVELAPFGMSTRETHAEMETMDARLDSNSIKVRLGDPARLAEFLDAVPPELVFGRGFQTALRFLKFPVRDGLAEAERELVVVGASPEVRTQLQGLAQVSAAALRLGADFRIDDYLQGLATTPFPAEYRTASSCGVFKNPNQRATALGRWYLDVDSADRPGDDLRAVSHAISSVAAQPGGRNFAQELAARTARHLVVVEDRWRRSVGEDCDSLMPEFRSALDEAQLTVERVWPGVMELARKDITLAEGYGLDS